MAMREPEAGGAGERQLDEDVDPVLRAMMTCPVGEPLSDDERVALEELGGEPYGVDHETMMALIAALPE
jgi:hypothetical protein